MRSLLISLVLILSTGLFAQGYSPEVQQQIDGYNKIIKSPFSSRIEKADAWNGLGWVYRLNYDYQRALAAHEESYDLFKKEDHTWGQALALSYIGYVYMAKKSYSLAMDYLQYSYKLFNNDGYKEEAAFVTTQMAWIHLYKFEYVKALETFEKAYTISEKVGNQQGMVNGLDGMAQVYQNMGNLPKALEYSEQSLVINRERHHKEGIAGNLLTIGWIYFEQGNFYKVIECGKESLSLYTDMYNGPGISASYNMIGLGYKELAVYDQALEYFKKSLAKSESLGDVPGIGTAYNNMATVYFMQRNLPQALKYHELGLNTNKEMGDKISQAISTNNVGTVYFNMGEVEKGKEYCLKAEKMALEIGNPRLIKMTKKLLFEIAAFQGDSAAAERYILEMIAVADKSIALNFPTLSESEKEKFFRNVSPDYMEFNQFVLKRKTGKPELVDLVYNNALRHKGLLLKSSTAMRHAILGSNDTSLITRYDAWITIKKQIAEGYANGDNTTELEDQANALEKELVKSSQAFSDLDKTQKLTWKDVRANLREGEAAIEFIHFNEFDVYGTKQDNVIYCALIVTAQSIHPEMVELCNEKELEALLGTFGGNNLQYINAIYGTRSEPQTELYRLVWQPIEPYIENANEIYLSPTGLLHRISFAAIAREKNMLLCDRYDIRQQSSTGKVVMPEKLELANGWKITLFGDIDYSTPNTSEKIWSYLEGTRLEVENIGRLFGADLFSVVHSKTEEGFKENAPESHIIHLSTHGFFYPDPDELTVSFETDTAETGDLVFRGTGSSFGVKTFVFNKNPLMRSGLVLSGANDVWNRSDAGGKEDGVLTAYEVAQIDLRNTGLVVLSACETGLGDINGSEGVYGLQRAFKMAGVRFIVMSLWQVPDNETQEFMTLFYQNLLEYREPKTAFSETRKIMRQKYDPYYWAAFVLVE